MGRATFTSAGVSRGLRLGLAFAPGIASFAIVFGILAAQAGLSPWLAGFMSFTVYAGTAQMLALHSWSTGGLLAVVAAVLAMNSRYVLFGAAMRPWTQGLPAWVVYASLFLLVVRNWVEAMREQREGRHDVGFFVGIGLTLEVVWTIASIAGAALGSGLDPVRFGLDFFLTAFFLCLAFGLWRGAADILPAVVAALVSLAVVWAGFGGWSIIAGALAGSLAGAIRGLPAHGS
jgi:predicted branched-subunit amino acid permease